MMFDYDFYTTDESFDYGDRTYDDVMAHGISVRIDSNDKIHSWSGYGHFTSEVNDIKTLSGLKQFILDNMYLVEEKENDKYSRKELLEELIEFIDNNVTKAA